MRRMTITLLAGAVALVGAAACGDDDDGGGDADTPNLETSQGVPDCFPEDTPVPDGDVQGGFSLDEGGTSICTFTVNVDGGVDEALTDYRSALEDDGWELAYEQPGEEGASLGMTKGDDGLAVGGVVLEDNTTLNVTAGTAESIAGAAPVVTGSAPATTAPAVAG